MRCGGEGGETVDARAVRLPLRPASEVGDGQVGLDRTSKQASKQASISRTNPLTVPDVVTVVIRSCRTCVVGELGDGEGEGVGGTRHRR